MTRIKWCPLWIACLVVLLAGNRLDWWGTNPGPYDLAVVVPIWAIGVNMGRLGQRQRDIEQRD